MKMQNNLGRDDVNLTLSKVIALGITMLSSMLLSRFRTLEEYGTYSQLMLVVQLAISIFTLGLPNSINFFLARTESSNERKNFLSTYYIFNTCLCVIMGLILFLLSPIVVKYFNNNAIKNFIYALLILPWATVIMSSIENILIVYKKTVNLILFRVSNSILLLIVIIVAVIFQLSFNIYMIMYVAVQSLYAIIVYFFVYKLENRLKLSVDKKLIYKILKFSIPLGLATMVGTISIEIDKLLVGAFYSTDQLAIYTNASKEMPVTIIASSLTAVLMPKLVRLLKNGKNNEVVKLWGETIILSYVFICFFTAFLFVFAPQIMEVLYSEKYLPGVNIFRIYSIVLLLRVTYFGMVLNSIGKTKMIFYCSIASLLLNVVFNFLFLYLFGMSGPAIATFLSILIVNLVQLIFTSHYLKISFKKLFPWHSLGIITIFNVILGSCFYFIQGWMSIERLYGSIVEAIILGSIWLAIYILVFFRLIKKSWNSINENIVERD